MSLNVGTCWQWSFIWIRKIHHYGKKIHDVLISAYGSLNQEMVAHNKLCIPKYKGFVKEFANKFQHLCSRITKSPISMGDKVERFLFGLKEDVQNKVLMNPRGHSGPWEDIKFLINYVVTINATYTQAAKGWDDVKSHSEVAITKGNGIWRPIRDKESCRSKANKIQHLCSHITKSSISKDKESRRSKARSSNSAGH